MGVKLYSGLKSDRVSDSLGSSADGVNTDVTIPTSLQEFTTDENTNLLHTSRRYGVRLKSGNPAIGGTCTGIAFKLLDDNFPSGNFYYKIYRSSDGGSTYSATAERTITIPDTDLPQSEAYLEKTLSSSIVLQEHDIITLQVDNLGQAGQEIEIGIATTDATIASANLEQAMWNIGNTNNAWTFSTSECPCIKIIGNPAKLGTGCYDYDGSSTTKTLLGETSMWDFIHTGSAWSMAFWINIPSVVEKQVFNQDENPPTHAFDYILLSSTNARLRVRGTSISYAHGFSADTWHHVVFTYDGTNIRIYTDGVLKNTPNGTAYTAGGNTGSDPITIAHSYVDSNHGNYLMDDCGFWERTLTSAEILDLVNNVDKSTTFASDFSSTSNWTSTDSAFAINTSDVAIIANNDNVTTNLQIGHDLGSGNELSDTAWVIDVDVKITAYTANSGLWTHIGMYDCDTTVLDSTNKDFLGMILYGESATNAIVLVEADNQLEGTLGPTTTSIAITGTPQLYLRMKRTASNKLTIESYSTLERTGAPITTTTRTFSGNPQNLRYFKITNRDGGGGGELDAKIENVKIWDGVTVPYDANGALVTSISKEKLKAYYSFDSLALSTGTEVSQITASDSGGRVVGFISGNYYAKRVGVEVSTGSTLIGLDNITAIKFRLGKTVGSPTGDMNCKIYNSSGTLQYTSESSSDVNVANLSTTILEEKTFTFDGTAKINSGDRVVVEGGNYSSSGHKFVEVEGSDDTPLVTGNRIVEFGLIGGGSDHWDAYTARSTWIKVTGDVAGCKNNYSSTSPLEALDGVRDNSIFTQTDDVPSYYWRQTLDGVTAWFPQLQYNFSDTSRWTATGDKTVNVTGNAIEASDFEGNDASERVYGEVGDLETKFVADFDYYQGTTGSGAYWSLCSFQSGTDYPFQSGMDSVGLIVDMGSYDVYTRSYDGSSENSTQTGDSISLSHSTQYSVRITRDGDDFTFSFYTDSARTYATKVGTRTLTDTGITGLKYFQSGYFTGGNSGAINYKITNLKIYNGVSSV